MSEQRPRRWEPATLLEEMQADLSRLFELGPFAVLPFGRALSRMPQISMAGMPRADVFEREGQIIVKAELPGIKKDDIDLAIEDGDLVLRAERKEEREVKDENWYRMERSYGSLYRRLPLPEGVQTDQITAALSDGVLEVTVPKPLANEAQTQKITVTAAQDSQ
jgi:HSP20 family protein